MGDVRAAARHDQRGPDQAGRHLGRVDRLTHRHPRAPDRGRWRDDHEPERQRRPRRAGGGGDGCVAARPGDRGDLLPRLPAAGNIRDRGDGARRDARRRLRPAGRLLRLPLRAGDRQQLHPQRHVPQRAGDRRRDSEPLPELEGPQHLRPLRGWRRRRAAPGIRPAGRADRLQPVQRWHRLRRDHRARRWIGLPRLPADQCRGQALHPDGGARGLQVRDPPARRFRRGRAARRGDWGGGCRSVRLPPGQPADHRKRPAPAVDPRREDLRQHREVREHERRVGADGTGRGDRRRAHQAGRQDPDGRLRGRLHGRRGGGRVDRRPGAGLPPPGEQTRLGKPRVVEPEMAVAG